MSLMRPDPYNERPLMSPGECVFLALLIVVAMLLWGLSGARV